MVTLKYLDKHKKYLSNNKYFDVTYLFIYLKVQQSSKYAGTSKAHTDLTN